MLTYTEVLEARRLLSATVIGSVLSISGTDAADQIALTTAGDSTTVQINNDSPQVIANDQFQSIEISAGGGDDTVSIADTIAQPATIDGGSGDDSLQGGAGDDLIVAGTGNDTIDGGAGWNTLDYSARTTPLVVNMDHTISADNGELDYYSGNIEVLKTGSGNDAISVNSAVENDVQVIDAGAGDDTVDFWRHNPGATVYGGDGNDDILIGNPARDAVYFGGAGNDNFRTYRSSDTGRDFHGGDGIDTVDYSPFNTGYAIVTIDDKPGDGVQEGDMYAPRDNVHTDVEVVIGTQLGDTITGSGNNETLIGGLGDDSIVGGGGNDSLQGDDGNDTLIAADGNDTLTGGEGADSLDGGAGADQINSDSSDTIVREAPPSRATNPSDASPQPISSNVPVAPPPAEPSPVAAPVLSSQTLATATDPAVALVGRVLKITGTEGDDQISVKPAGNGMIDVNVNGVVSEFSAMVVKRIDVSALSGKDRIDLEAISISSRIKGGAGDDTIYGSAANDRISGGDGNDWICGCAGKDVIYGNGGNDRLFGAAGNDYIRGGAGRDLIRAGTGLDRIFATATIDDVRGNRGDSIIGEIGIL